MEWRYCLKTHAWLVLKLNSVLIVTCHGWATLSRSLIEPRLWPCLRLHPTELEELCLNRTPKAQRPYSISLKARGRENDLASALPEPTVFSM